LQTFRNCSGCQVHGSRFRVGCFALFMFFEIVDESTNRKRVSIWAPRINQFSLSLNRGTLNFEPV
jgi:hypothetical protein